MKARVGVLPAWVIGLAYWLSLLSSAMIFHNEIMSIALQVAGLPVGLLFLMLARRESSARAEALAYRDHLTGLPNRAYFMDTLVAALARAQRANKHVAVLFLDLDRFKRMNDTLGHAAGDALLIEVSTRLRRHIRAGEAIARLGGDEFTILLESVQDQTAAEIVAKRVLSAMEKPFQINGHEFAVSTSIGIALSNGAPIPADELIRRADVALYDAKANGRGCWSFFRHEKGMNTVERLELNSELRNAIKAGQLRLYFQPEVNLDTGRIEGFEALVRWNHPERGLLAPAAFIHTAEEDGLISAIGRWVLRQACVEAVEWEQRFPDLMPLAVSVNLSPVEFQQRELVGEVSRVLSETGLDPSRLKIEIVETALMSDAEATMTTLHGFRQLGVKLAIDDFGTGYSSLSYLRKFPVDTIKIDQSFVREATTDRDVSAIISSIISLAHALGIDVTAEGVETQEQLSFLVRNGCDRAQGYLFARPLPHEGLSRFLQASKKEEPVAVA